MSSLRRHAAALGLIAAALPLQVLSQPTVIHSGKGAVPMGTYLGHLVAGVDQAGVLEGVKFPIRSDLRPGVLSDAQAQGTRGLFRPQWMAHPVFLVGTDPLSRQWLSQHRQSLIELGASGIVVQAESERTFKEMQQLAGGASLAPMAGDWLTAALRGAGAPFYPLVILADGRLTSVPPRNHLAPTGQQP
jgi:integrating conjugative element protein (TIGR03765 family)